MYLYIYILYIFVHLWLLLLLLYNTVWYCVHINSIHIIHIISANNTFKNVFCCLGNRFKLSPALHPPDPWRSCHTGRTASSRPWHLGRSAGDNLLRKTKEPTKTNNKTTSPAWKRLQYMFQYVSSFSRIFPANWSEKCRFVQPSNCG